MTQTEVYYCAECDFQTDDGTEVGKSFSCPECNGSISSRIQD